MRAFLLLSALLAAAATTGVFAAALTSSMLDVDVDVDDVALLDSAAADGIDGVDNDVEYAQSAAALRWCKKMREQCLRGKGGHACYRKWRCTNNDDSACTARGGVCAIWSGVLARGKCVGSTLVNQCLSNGDPAYTCCVPDGKAARRRAEEKSDARCRALGGQCGVWSPGTPGAAHCASQRVESNKCLSSMSSSYRCCLPTSTKRAANDDSCTVGLGGRCAVWSAARPCDGRTVANACLSSRATAYQCCMPKHEAGTCDSHALRMCLERSGDVRGCYTSTHCAYDEHRRASKKHMNKVVHEHARNHRSAPIAGLSGGGRAQFGGDVSQLVSSTSARALVAAKLNFFVVRAYQSVGRADKNAPASVAAFWSAGALFVDVYMFPCPKCSKGAAAQVDEMLDYLEAHKVKFGVVWLDLEGTQYWHSSQSKNRAFYEHMLAASSRRAPTGVYSSSVQWTGLFGAGYRSPRTDVPLWVAHYDNKATYADFHPFGGWSAPTMKQFTPNVMKHGAGYDLNWMDAPSLHRRLEFVRGWHPLGSTAGGHSNADSASLASAPAPTSTKKHTGGVTISAHGRQQMAAALNYALKHNAGGSFGNCFAYVWRYLTSSGACYGKICRWRDCKNMGSQYAKDFNTFFAVAANSRHWALQRLPITSPYDAPAGAVCVVAPDTPGTSNPVAGDIAIARGNGLFCNDGCHMAYGAPASFPGLARNGRNGLLGCYVPV